MSNRKYHVRHNRADGNYSGSGLKVAMPTLESLRAKQAWMLPFIQEGLPIPAERPVEVEA
jgi:hypothetical protein